ncbi:MAG: DUF1206 domain-containing protein [Cyanobacteria bacterium P01_A01_bin.15]
MALSKKVHQTIEFWIEHYARIGYGAKGIVYGTAGLLALMQAFDLNRGETVGSEGALKTIAAQPFGRGLLVVLAISLVGYVMWRFIQAIFDPEHRGSSMADILRRISYACSGFAYGGIAFSAVKILRIFSTSDGKTAEQWAFEIMLQPFGRWIVGAGGLTVFGIGCYYFYRVIKAEFRQRFKRQQMSDSTRTWTTLVGRVGIAARGFVYVVIGCYGLRAAWEFDSSMIKTTEDALAVFDNNPTDEWILAILGMGFIAYGIHMGFQSVYRSIDPM